jgi:hypothetical protein
LHEGVDAAWRIDGRAGTATLKETVILAVAVNVISGDLSGGVDALYEGVGERVPVGVADDEGASVVANNWTAHLPRQSD